jgi:hypothetical protein|tara:strand:- start:168 stop:527 length:360 start_codon:yes stop_codon:yes gene_type:complete
MKPITINNASQREENLIRAVAKHTLKGLGLTRKRKLTIHFRLLDKEDCHGEIEQDDKWTYSIDLASNYKTIKDFVGTIAHELTHIAQWLDEDSYEGDGEDEADQVAEWVVETMWEENLI